MSAKDGKETKAPVVVAPKKKVVVDPAVTAGRVAWSRDGSSKLWSNLDKGKLLLVTAPFDQFCAEHPDAKLCLDSYCKVMGNVYLSSRTIHIDDYSKMMSKVHLASYTFDEVSKSTVGSEAEQKALKNAVNAMRLLHRCQVAVGAFFATRGATPAELKLAIQNAVQAFSTIPSISMDTALLVFGADETDNVDHAIAFFGAAFDHLRADCWQFSDDSAATFYSNVAHKFFGEAMQGFMWGIAHRIPVRDVPAEAIKEMNGIMGGDVYRALKKRGLDTRDPPCPPCAPSLS